MKDTFIWLILLSFVSVSLPNKYSNADEVLLGKDTKKLFPQELTERYQGKLPQNKLVSGQLADTALLTGNKKVTKVEIIDVKPVSGNNPFYQTDPINNTFYNGKVYPVSVDNLAKYLSGNTGGGSGGGGTPPPSSKFATFNFTSEPSGQAEVFFEHYQNSLGKTPATTLYDPSKYNFVWFAYKYNTSFISGLTCEGNITNILPGETINVNFKLPKEPVSSGNINLLIDNNDQKIAYARFNIDTNNFTITGQSGIGDSNNAISVKVVIDGGLTKRFYTAGSNWKFLNQYYDTAGNTILYTSSSGSAVLQEISTGKKIKVDLYTSVLAIGIITSGYTNITISDILPKPCYETTHSNDPLL